MKGRQPVTLRGEGQAVPALTLIEAQNANEGDVYWGFQQGNGDFLLRNQGVTLVDRDAPRPFGQGRTLVAGQPFPWSGLLLLERKETQA